METLTNGGGAETARHGIGSPGGTLCSLHGERVLPAYVEMFTLKSMQMLIPGGCSVLKTTCCFVCGGRT